MNTAFLLLKSSLFLFCAVTYFRDTESISALFVLSQLMITAFSFLIPVLKNRTGKIILAGLSIISIFIFLSRFPFTLLYLPVLISEMTTLLGIPMVYAMILNLAGFPFTLQTGLEATYILIYTTALLLLLFAALEKKLTAQISQNDSLRLTNQKLLKRVEYGEALTSQISYTAQLEERNRIAQELHDKLGHSLSGSLMQLEAVKLLTVSDPPKAGELLQRVVDTLRGGLDSIRVTLRNIKPPSEQMGINRLQLLVDDFKSKHPITIHLSHEGDLSRIKPAVWKIFSDNTTEALTNIIRHSHADRVSLSILVLNKVVRYQIKDNGQNVKPIIKGLGLAGMEERLLLVSGSLIVDNSNGFSIIMLVPNEV